MVLEQVTQALFTRREIHPGVIAFKDRGYGFFGILGEKPLPPVAPDHCLNLGPSSLSERPLSEKNGPRVGAPLGAIPQRQNQTGPRDPTTEAR